MGREVRKVPKNWEHPKDERGEYKPLFDNYNSDVSEFMEMANKEGLQKAIDYMSCPNQDDYMPEWTESEKTHLMMYETTTEGTPISPAFESPEELARWLVDNHASAMGSSEASYEGWLRVCLGGYVPSMVITGSKIQSGVDAFSEE